MYQYNVQLQPYNSFKTEAFAKIFCEPTSIEELKQCFLDFPNEKKLILGGGCNLFFTENFEGIVIKPIILGIQEFSNTSDYVFIEVMASQDWDEFVNFCVNNNYSGLENLSYIPGTVGASPIQNIGAYGAEAKDCINKVVALNTKTLDIVSFSNKECEFEYRNSFFKKNNNQYVILSVEFKLNKSYTYIPKYSDLNKELDKLENPTIKDVREAVIRIRQRKLPDEKILPNAGSFFKNPYISKELADKIITEFPNLPLYPIEGDLLKTSAAFLIDKVGYKGKRIGNVGTYDNQALIIVNYGSTDGKDIVSLMKQIQKTVFDKFEIKLEPEVWII